MMPHMAPGASTLRKPSAASHQTAASWCCVQSGHRERYGVARALLRAGRLERLITDLWVPPGSALSAWAKGPVGRRLRDRYDPEIPAARVADAGLRSLSWELLARLRGLAGSDRVLARNAWWGRVAAGLLGSAAGASTRFVFGYCYESLPVFRAARQRGLVPILGQMDPGPAEDGKVADVVARWPGYSTPFRPGSRDYYERWSEECALAGRIVVNSDWSRAALEQAGVAPAKIAVCPLVYTPPPEASLHTRSFPERFSASRPLRVLFLGQCILRKGIAETLEAARALAGRPVEFTLVGNTDIADLPRHFGDARVRRFERVTRSECHAFYREADLFLLPTHSDGFGLTQLEAQAWGLPLIASRFCGQVVEDGRTGWVLPEVSSSAILAALDEVLAHPERLAERSLAIRPWPYGLDQLAADLCTVANEAA